jgi:hypothetical protein
MTRSAWVTARLPGASTAPATRTRTRFHTGAVKQQRNADSQAARAGGIRCGSDAVAVHRRFGAIPGVESSRAGAARVCRRYPPARRSIVNVMAEDPIIQRIESFHCRRGQLFAERRNRGYTLYRASSGALVARLRPTGQGDRVEVLYWSLWKERWTKAGPFGRTVLPLDQALKFIASEDIFWAIQ